ncbi:MULTISPECIES: type II toxin-antitoxin system RelE/ParE family toxin [Burkholderia]|uniref:Type II toxin-antitoxin system RelE/ParE family toxin n=2 Tax=Burkholderia cepacia complex TaxID=87882 RepID=A0A2S5E2X7_9BURK|nr:MULTISPECIES: type II toxin-antitoxin system RelE/ParE family toxin [Burkholderia]EKS9799052.1 type II toxin-antitoxin system RelE/ParE family toxin [Burkholderia cepacia]EKS9806006.1 type II toxin-antitoxin system RelE/ParE family toxin [Burkholderia cepacia]EKS9813554.1 type II toxin-antitoxin system RelE/ParE family toxin [Burkholderia cepacia]EKS9823679.1 type II toxin-antitoxin system RelE/ParE family toxin [Burkholderia cepacia]EKS9827938.1 type II toxin-antitoxin system RelE/ParE fam
MSYPVRYTRAAREDLVRLYRYLLERDVDAAARALEAIERGVAMLRLFPFTCRKIDEGNPFLRELIVSFGTSGYVLLFEIESAEQVTILAVRHQREDDYH